MSKTETLLKRLRKKNRECVSAGDSFIIGKKIRVPEMNVYNALLRRSTVNASPVLALCHEDKLTMQRLKAESGVYARAFLAMGVKKGDIVAITLPPCIEGILAFFALNRIGAVTTFLESNAGKEEIENYLRRFSASILFSSTKNADILPSLADSCCVSIIAVAAADAFGALPAPCKLTQELLKNDRPVPKHSRIMSLAVFKNKGTDIALCEPLAKADDPALISFTSGTTGEPKAIVLSNGNVLAEMIGNRKRSLMQFGPLGNSMQVVPFNYPYGFLITTIFPMFAGKTAALTPVLTPNHLSAYLDIYRPAYIQAIPFIYTYMLLSESFRSKDLSYLKYAISGGDSLCLTDKLKINKFFKMHGSSARILDGSGNGEGGGALTISASLLGMYEPRSIGRPVFGLTVKFVDADGKTVPIGETGRFCFAGKNVMLGYYNDPAGTQKVKYTDADGIEWFHTDTYGHMDRKGWIYFDGRARRFFITFDVNGSPFKVYCDHVQECIMQSSLVRACAVVQRSDNNRGLVPVAYLAAKDDGDFSVLCEAIKHYCSDKLQSCACPTVYYPLEELPMTRAGKVDYRALEKLAAAQADS